MYFERNTRSVIEVNGQYRTIAMNDFADLIREFMGDEAADCHAEIMRGIAENQKWEQEKAEKANWDQGFQAGKDLMDSLLYDVLEKLRDIAEHPNYTKSQMATIVRQAMREIMANT